MMTIEEAIEELRINGKKEPLEISGSAKRMTRYFEALAIAEEALEKQIAKKPIGKFRIGEFRYSPHYSCPTCKEEVQINYDMTYCLDCGQKLDWSETDE